MDAAFLFEHHWQRNYSYSKATNIGKFLARIFFAGLPRFEVFLPDDRDKPLQLRWIGHLKLHMDLKVNKTLKDMEQLFGEAESTRRDRWSRVRREFMQQLLTEPGAKIEQVLSNNYIKQAQKVNYLYSLKMYEWRLNDSRTVKNFN